MNILRGKASLFSMMMLMVCMTTVQSAEMVQKCGGMVVCIKSIEEFDKYLQSGNPLAVYFSSPTCGPCKVFHDTYHTMAQEFPDVIFLEVSYGTFLGSETLLTKYSIRSFPTFLFF